MRKSTLAILIGIFVVINKLRSGSTAENQQKVRNAKELPPDTQKRSTTLIENPDNVRPRDNPIALKPAPAPPKFKKFVAIANLGIGILTLLVLVFQLKLFFDQKEIMKTQSKIMEQQTQFMEKSFLVSERAYVGVGEVKAHIPNREVLVMLQNIGKVPATAVKVKVQQFRATAEGTEQKGTISPWDAGEVELFPGTPMPVVISLEPFEQNEANAIFSKQAILYIVGTIEYMDGFGNSVKTTFAFEYNPPPQDRWVAHSDLSKIFKRPER